MTFEGKNADLNIIKNISEVNDIDYIKDVLMFYIKDNENLVKELRSIRHNTLNILHGINSFIELEDWNGLKEYFNDILECSRRIVDTNLSSIEKIQNPSLKKLLYDKLEVITNTGINFKVMVDENILIGNNLIDESDLCTVMEQFLDNAIEASLEAFIKKVSIFILANENSISIIVENTFKEKQNIPLLKVEFPKREEIMKPGLQSISAILSKYPHILNNNFVQHQVFIQELQIIK